SSSDRAYWAKDHRAGERAEGGIAGSFLRDSAKRHDSQSGDTYDSKALHHSSPLVRQRHGYHSAALLDLIVRCAPPCSITASGSCVAVRRRNERRPEARPAGPSKDVSFTNLPAST